MNSYSFRKMRAVRRDIISMFSSFIKNCSAEKMGNKYLPGFANLLEAYQ